MSEVCAAMDVVAKQRPVLAQELRPRIGVENRLPEFIEEALHLPQLPAGSDAGAAPDFAGCGGSSGGPLFPLHAARRVRSHGGSGEGTRFGGQQQLRDMLRTGQPRQAASAVGLMSRLDVPSLLELLPARLPEWNRFYHDVVVRQIAYGAAHDRGRSLLELLEILDPLVLPQALDEIGMSGDRTAVPPLVVIAEAGEAQGRSPLLQVKAVESLGRLRGTGGGASTSQPAGSQENVEVGQSPGVADCRSPGAGQDRSALWQPGVVGQRAGTGRTGDRRRSMRRRRVPGCGNGAMSASCCARRFRQPSAVPGASPAC